MHQNEDQYKEIMKDLKSEKMNWDFDEFLKATEKTETTTAPLTKSKSASLPKFFWMAASAAVLLQSECCSVCLVKARLSNKTNW